MYVYIHVHVHFVIMATCTYSLDLELYNTHGYEWRQPGLVFLGGAGVCTAVCGNEEADKVLTLRFLVHLVYIKPNGVPDKLCVFSADES